MHDKEFGLIYNRARYLHPILGRFMQPDKLEYIDGMNLYEYVKSNPVKWRDPLGLCKKGDCEVRILPLDKDMLEGLALRIYGINLNKYFELEVGDVDDGIDGGDIFEKLQKKLLKKLLKKLGKGKAAKVFLLALKAETLGINIANDTRITQAELYAELEDVQYERRGCCSERIWKTWHGIPYRGNSSWGVWKKWKTKTTDLSFLLDEKHWGDSGNEGYAITDPIGLRKVIRDLENMINQAILVNIEKHALDEIAKETGCKAVK